MLDVLLGNCPLYRIQDVLHLFFLLIQKDNGKFITAIAIRPYTVPLHRQQCAANLHQCLIPHLMTIQIIVFLKIIDIQHSDCKSVRFK